MARQRSEALDGTIIRSLFGESSASQIAPAGYTPVGDDSQGSGCDSNEIPQSTDELGELTSLTYDLTVRRAGELNIPVAGTVSGGFDRRVLVWEWTRFKELHGSDGIRCRYGYTVRFCLTVSKWEAQAKMSLPFLSAQAELGNVQASWLMQVRGLVGPKIDSVVLPPQELKVETFVLARQSMEAVISAISDPSTRFSPGILLARVDPSSAPVLYWRSAVVAFSVDQVRRGRSRQQAIARLGPAEQTELDLVSEVYEYFGLTDPSAQPKSGARDQAQAILRGIRVDV